MNGSPTRVSVLTLVQEFDSSLRNAIQPLLAAEQQPGSPSSSAFLHPLSSLPSPAQTKLHLQSTLSTLKTTLAAFSPALNSGLGAKTLAALREHAGSEAVLLSHQSDIHNLKQSLASRPTYPLIPPLATPSAQQTLAILNQIGHANSLALFTDHAPSSDLHTITLGGALMVVDVDVLPSGAIAKAKFSYVSATHTYDEDVAKEIEACLQGMDAIHLPLRQPEIEQGLQKFSKLLKELKRLDELTEKSTRDCFALVKELTKELQATLQTEELAQPSVFSPDSHGALIEAAISPRPQINYHARASLLLPSAASTFRPSQKTPGCSSLELHLDHAWDSEPPVFIATLDPPLPVTAETGRRILEATGKSTLLSSDQGSEEAETRKRKRGLGTLVPFEDLFRPPSPVSDPSPTNSFTFDDLVSPQSFSLASPASLAGYLCTDIRFNTLEQLFSAIEILKEQHLINDLITSVLASPINASPSKSSTTSKRRKPNPTPTLASLFDADPTTPTPIFLHLHFSPALTLSFPTPHVPPSESYPMTLQITSDKSFSTGLKVKFTFGRSGEGGSEKLETGAEKVVGLARDLPLLMRWVWKEFEKKKRKGE